MKPDSIQRIYRALIVTPENPEKASRTETMAASLSEAKEKLEMEYGKGSVYSLYNEEDANKPRCGGGGAVQSVSKEEINE